MRRAPIQTRVYPEILKNVLYAIFVFRSQNTDIRDPRICVSLSSGTDIHDLPNFCITVFKYKNTNQPAASLQTYLHTGFGNILYSALSNCAHTHCSGHFFVKRTLAARLHQRAVAFVKTSLFKSCHHVYRLQGERSVHLLQALDYL